MRFVRKHPSGLAIALAFGFSLALVRAGTVEERDSFWQVRAGLDTLGGAPLIRADSWSWDSVPNDFVQTSPGWNVVLAIAWEQASYVGLFAITFSSIVAYLVVAAALAARLGARPLPALLGFAPVIALGLSFISPRAALAAQTLFLVGVLTANWWRFRSTTLGPVAAVAGHSAFLFATTVIGIWLHLSWLLFAPALLVSTSILWATADKWSRSVRAVAVTAGIPAVGFGLAAGPYGLSVVEVSRRVQDACRGVVAEWLPAYTPGLATRWLPAAIVAVLLSSAAIAWAARRVLTGRTTSRVSLTLALLALAAPTALLGVFTIRFIGVSLLTLTPITAAAASVMALRISARRDEEPPRGVMRLDRVRFWADGHRWPAVLVGVLVVLSPLTALMTAPLGRPLPEVRLLDSLPAGCRLLSTPGTAAPVLLLRPDVAVWWDGRFDYYGRARNVRNIDVLVDGSLEDESLRSANCVMLDRSDGLDVSRLTAALNASPEWTLVEVVDPGSVWVRSEG